MRIQRIVRIAFERLVTRSAEHGARANGEDSHQ
jgi:hypothetical protein